MVIEVSSQVRNSSTQSKSEELVTLIQSADCLKMHSQFAIERNKTRRCQRMRVISCDVIYVHERNSLTLLLRKRFGLVFSRGKASEESAICNLSVHLKYDFIDFAAARGEIKHKIVRKEIVYYKNLLSFPSYEMRNRRY